MGRALREAWKGRCFSLFDFDSLPGLGAGAQGMTADVRAAATLQHIRGVV